MKYRSLILVVLALVLFSVSSGVFAQDGERHSVPILAGKTCITANQQVMVEIHARPNFESETLAVLHYGDIVRMHRYGYGGENYWYQVEFNDINGFVPGWQVHMVYAWCRDYDPEPVEPIAENAHFHPFFILLPNPIDMENNDIVSFNRNGISFEQAERICADRDGRLPTDEDLAWLYGLGGPFEGQYDVYILSSTRVEDMYVYMSFGNLVYRPHYPNARTWAPSGVTVHCIVPRS